MCLSVVVEHTSFLNLSPTHPVTHTHTPVHTFSYLHHPPARTHTHIHPPLLLTHTRAHTFNFPHHPCMHTHKHILPMHTFTHLLHPHIQWHTHSPTLSTTLQMCVAQIFDTRQVDVTHNKILFDEFALNMDNILQSITSRVGEANEMGQRKKLIGLCGLIVLNFQLFNSLDKKFIRSVWELHRRVCLNKN